MVARKSILLLASFFCVAVGGCQEQVERVPVSGTVTFDGESVEDGQVAFEPLTGGRMEFGIISEGKYSIPKEFGLVPGEYLVRITAGRPTGELATPDAFSREVESSSLMIYEPFIPAKYNSASKLKVEIEPVEHMQQDFALTTD